MIPHTVLPNLNFVWERRVRIIPLEVIHGRLPVMAYVSTILLTRQTERDPRADLECHDEARRAGARLLRLPNTQLIFG